ncbi:Hypothetical protein RSal33209_2881 [Renibacterium salmoninarum ATCC 33209]|uniref:Uncharacterized protein n=1 Tax=Renibacterium salmoninarum (strain ATCC 33209 / DSM 20767 / JCM 11484 / NBRC 15589 / NCIMB 2235) TaxID=288705 RepID=A9WTT4_RENSM|nr:Hypothetical protein RSal33209_2881 [Renibacterium salmoninarum ATCC 33209]
MKPDGSAHHRAPPMRYCDRLRLEYLRKYRTAVGCRLQPTSPQRRWSVTVQCRLPSTKKRPPRPCRPLWSV